MSIQKFAARDIGREDEARLQAALSAMEGVLYVSVSCSEGCVEVEFEDDCVTAEEMREVARAHGFELKIAG